MVIRAQIATGIFLSMFSVNNATDSFDSIIIISRNVRIGWMVRFFHINGASLIFILIYAHIARNIIFSSPTTKKHTWARGITLLVLLIATAFLGYVLPWGQISF
jgi:quinol-cytochrome oxidoreductase complex cytochrome b subunit